MPRAHGFPIVAALLLSPLAAAAQPPTAPAPRLLDSPQPLNISPATDTGFYRPGSAGPYGVTAESASALLAPEPVALERPGTAPGWYAAVTLGLVKPHLTNHVSSGTPLAPVFPAPVQLPFAAQDWTVSPRFEAGYHLPHGRGDLRVGYRFLNSQGSDGGAWGDVNSRLSLNVIDLDYLSPEWLVENPLGPWRDLRLVGGVRIAAAHFDSAGRGGAVVEDRFTSHFVGAGPRFGVEWRKPVFTSPLEFYARADASGVLGRVRQDFALGVRDDAGRVFGAARQGDPKSSGVAVVGVEAGFAWRPTAMTCVVCGYQYEQWWNLGRTDDSNAELVIQGVFLRGEWRY